MIKAIFKGLMNLGATVFLQLVSFVAGFYCARELSLSEFGTLSLMKTIFLYASCASLGIKEALMYRLPQAIASNDRAKIKLNQKILFTVSFLTIIFMIPFSLLALFKIPLNGNILGIEWILIALIVFVTNLAHNSEVLYTSYENFSGLAMMKFFYPLAFGALFWLLFFRYHLNGYLIAMFSGYLIMFIFSLYFTKGKMGFIWRPKKKVELIKQGGPIKASHIVWILFISLDLWIVSFFIDEDSAGVYGLVMLICNSYLLIPMVLGRFIQPRISGFYARVKGDDAQIEGHYKTIITSFVLVGISISVMVLTFFYILINVTLTKYSGVLLLIPILVTGYMIEIIRYVTNDLLILKGEQVKVLAVNIFVLVLVFLLDLGAAIIFRSLTLVAVSTAIGLALNGVLNFSILACYFRIKGFPLFVAKIVALFMAGGFIIWRTYFILSEHIVGNTLFELVFNPWLLLPVLMAGLPLLCGFFLFLKFWHGLSRRLEESL